MTDHITFPKHYFILIAVSPYLCLAFANGFYNPMLFSSQVEIFWLLEVTQMIIFPIGAIYFLSKLMALKPRDYGLVRSGNHYPAWEMIGAGLFSAIFLIMIGNASWYGGVILFGREDFVFSFGMAVPEGKWHIPVVIYFAASAGIVEEVIFRGLGWKVFSDLNLKRLKKPLYVIATSLVFAATHWEQGLAGIFSSFAFGVVAALLYLQLRNLWPMIAAHTLVDVYYFW